MLTFEPAEVHVGQEVLSDLHDRLRRTRFHPAIADPEWEAGTDPAYLRELVAYWLDGFDWRAQEARINRFDQVATTVDGQPIHLFHVRSPEPDATPLLLVHGWPGSIVEFLDVLGPLTDPRAHGGDPADAFHVVAPSLPGYPFSGPTVAAGWHPRRIAQAFVEIMDALGYDRYGAQGGDWGYLVTSNVADLAPDRVVGLHLNFVVARPPKGEQPMLTEDEQRHLDAARVAKVGRWLPGDPGHEAAHGRRRPRRLAGRARGLAGREVPRLERLRRRRRALLHQGPAADQHHRLLGHAQRDLVVPPLLRGAPGRRGSARPRRYIDVPTGIANFPAEVTKVPRAWVESRYRVVHWTHPSRGGHFAAMEVPDLFVDDVRTFFRGVRTSM